MAKIRYQLNPLFSSQAPVPKTVIKQDMLVAPELLQSMERVRDFADDPFMADLSKRFWFWQDHTRVLKRGYNHEVIAECVYTAVNRILAKYPDTGVEILPHLDLRELDLDQDDCPKKCGQAIAQAHPGYSMPRLAGCSVRYALIHHPDGELSGTHRVSLRTRDGAAHALKACGKDLSCCIVIEAQEVRQGGLYTYRQDVVAAASALMSRTSLTEVRTCITDGKYWMFGRLQEEDDGLRVFRDTDPLPLETPPALRGPDSTMRSQLSVVVGLLAGFIDGVAPFIGDAQEVTESNTP